MTVNCSCKAKDCKTKIVVETSDYSIQLWLVDHPKAGPTDLMMYLDPNGAVALIKELQRAIGRLVGSEKDP